MRTIDCCNCRLGDVNSTTLGMPTCERNRCSTHPPRCPLAGLVHTLRIHSTPLSADA
ncbi:hypothetical protein K525DRAFT_148425, partial [Schizophyllum commune Loenen D]